MSYVAPIFRGQFFFLSQGLEDWQEAIRDTERALHLDPKDGNTKRKVEQAKGVCDLIVVRDMPCILWDL